jgi:glycosyltransferase involved in cell wall biosynthesis
MGTGGAESVVCDLAADAAARGDQVALLAARGPLDARISHVPLARFLLPDPGREPVRTMRAALATRAALREFRPDLIHAHNPRVTAGVLLGRRLAGMTGTPLLATFHAGPPERDRSVARVLSRVKLVACVSEPLRDKLVAEGLDAGRVVVVRNGVAAARGPAGARGDHPTVVAVGRLAPEKAHWRYLEAVAIAARELPDARFMLVGDGPLRAQLERQAGELGLGERLEMTGSRPDARDLIAASDLLVLTSDREGLPIVALEGLAAGVPLLSTELPGVDELVRGGAAVVAPHDPAALAGRMVELLRDPARLAELSAGATALYEREFSVDRMVEEYRRLYERL